MTKTGKLKVEKFSCGALYGTPLAFTLGLKDLLATSLTFPMIRKTCACSNFFVLSVFCSFICVCLRVLGYEFS
jgi:hypothetical protein